MDGKYDNCLNRFCIFDGKFVEADRLDDNQVMIHIHVQKLKAENVSQIDAVQQSTTFGTMPE
jgi:hypothetical protein